MKLPELKEKLKSKYIVRVVAGVLTIALVGTGIGVTAVFAEKNSTAVTAEADSTTDSSKDADDIADKHASYSVRRLVRLTGKVTLPLSEMPVSV